MQTRGAAARHRQARHPRSLLHKPGPLTPAEYEQVKQHAVIGADMLSAMSLPGPLALIVRHHHENWDGTGYPDGLRGDGIPLGARVLAIVDCYDALTSDRPYRRALSHDRAIDDDSRAPRHDVRPGIADAFLRIVQRLRRARRPGPRAGRRRPSECGRTCDGCARRDMSAARRRPDADLLGPCRSATRVVRRRGRASRGAACLVAAAMHLRFEHAGLFAVLLGARDGDVGGEDRAAARPQPVEPVAVARGELLGAVRARPGARPSASPRSSAWAQCTLRAGAAATRCTASSSASAR